MTKEPLVCICLLSYNTAPTIGEALESILAQTYGNIVVKVVDNNSTDRSREIVEKIAGRDRRVTFFAGERNVGAFGNYERAIALAEGEYTAIFHSDDIYAPEMVRKEVEFLESHRRAGAVFTEAIRIDHSGKLLGPILAPSHLPLSGEYSFDEILRAIIKRGNFLMCPTAMLRTDVYKQEVLPVPQAQYGTSADLGMWLKVAEKHTIGIIREPLLKYRVSQHSFSFKQVRTRTSMQDMFLVLDDYVAKFSKSLSSDDMRNYRLLKYREKVNVAINLIISGEAGKARTLLAGVLFSVADIFDAAAVPWFYKYVAIAAVSFVLTFIPIGRYGREFFFNFRYGTACR